MLLNNVTWFNVYPKIKTETSQHLIYLEFLIQLAAVAIQHSQIERTEVGIKTVIAII